MSGSKCLSTLCVPPGVGKRLPLVVHSGGNILFEEPCLAYLNLFVSEVEPPSPFFGTCVHQPPCI